MKKLIILLIFSCLLLPAAEAQKPKEFGGEFLKTFGSNFKGTMASARFEQYISKSSWSVGATFSFSSRKSYSQFKGYSLFAGYRYGFTVSTSGSNPFIGARVWLGLNNFDGKSNLGSVFAMPMIEAGYHIVLGKSFFTSPTIGYGFTKKMSFDYNSLAEDEGGRFAAGLSAGLRVK